MSFLSQLFLHPGIAALGAGLIAVPIVIHLINRLQYRKVRFAAMEFLLQSQQRNRRRLLFEQLLLLLLRILMVLLLAALFARLILDPTQLAMLERVETHHVVLLDDSGSMRDRWGEGTAYDAGLDVVKRLASELAGQEGVQTITLLRTSEPDRTSSSFTQREADASMVSEFEDRLETMSRECGYGRPSWDQAMSAIERILASGAGRQQVVHVISDFRQPEWTQSPELLDRIDQLAGEEVLVNLVPAVPAPHNNLAVSGITGDVHTAAVQVPLQLTASVTNYGQSLAENVAVRVLIDEEPIPQSISIPAIEAGETVTESFEVTLTTPGEHVIAVQIPADALEADNTRYLTMNVPDKQRVLVADGSPEFREGLYVADALSADSGITGLDVLIIPPDELRDQDLSQYTAVYLLNVPQLPPDAQSLLEDYVRSGGGIAWFMGNQIAPGYYRQLASGQEESEADSGDGESEAEQPAASGQITLNDSLFPIPLAGSPIELPRADETNPGADLDLNDHPVFSFLNAADGLLAYYVNIYRYFPLDLAAGEKLPSSVEVIGRLRNEAPLFLESRLGEGRIFLALTSAGPVVDEMGERWHNWPFDTNAPGFTVFHLELVKYLGARRDGRGDLLVGEPLQVKLNPNVYLPEVRIDSPSSVGTSAVTINATAAAEETENGETENGKADAADSGSSETEDAALVADFSQTSHPGVYAITRESIARESETELRAVNVPADEGDLETSTVEQLRTALAGNAQILVQDFGELVGIQRSDPGKELRTTLLILLVLVLLAEQAMAYRLSYHTRGTGGSSGQRKPSRRGPARAGRDPGRRSAVSQGGPV
ncbi:MAG: hypothetical protein CMJ47_00575 [Planctomyces sp.]|nr:hypothetical protein [Planctomyces sp.]